MACEYAGLEYEDRYYAFKPTENGWCGKDWSEGSSSFLSHTQTHTDNFQHQTHSEPFTLYSGAKPQLRERNALINLPYIEHGSDLVAQTNACLAYIGRLTGLNGTTEDEVWRNEQALCEVMDLRNAGEPFRPVRMYVCMYVCMHGLCTLHGPSLFERLCECGGGGRGHVNIFV